MSPFPGVHPSPLPNPPLASPPLPLIDQTPSCDCYKFGIIFNDNKNRSRIRTLLRPITTSSLIRPYGEDMRRRGRARFPEKIVVRLSFYDRGSLVAPVNHNLDHETAARPKIVGDEVLVTRRGGGHGAGETPIQPRTWEAVWKNFRPPPPLSNNMWSRKRPLRPYLRSPPPPPNVSAPP